MQEIERELRNVPQMLESARHEAAEQARNLRNAETLVIETAADELVANWLGSDSLNLSPAEKFAATLARLMAEEAAKVRERAEQTRSRLTELLQTATRLLPSAKPAIQELPGAAGLPLPDASALTGKVNLRPPRTARLLGRTVLRHNLQKQLSEQAGLALRDFLTQYSQRLAQWAKSAFADLEAAFTANAGILQAQLARRKPAETGPADGELQEDIRLLEQWERRKTPALEPVS